MGEQKRPFSLRISEDLYGALERQAQREGRPPANLGEVLLRWAYEQLQAAGNSLTLLSWEAQPKNRAKELASSVRIDQEVVSHGHADRKPRKAG